MLKGMHLLRVVAATLALIMPLIVYSSHGIEDLVPNVSAERVKKLMDAAEKILLFDLRSPKDFQEKRLPGAHSLPLSEFDKRAREIPMTGRVILYCDCQLYQIIEKAIFLENLGYRNVAVMLDGFPGWIKLGYPLEVRP